VYARALVEPIARVLGALGSERALVVHGADGLDEITLTGPTFAALLEQGGVRSLTLEPEALGLSLAPAAALAGGDAAENARITRAILEGEPGPRQDVVVLNAGAALWIADAAPDLAAGVALARRSLASGAAKAKLAALVEASRRLARP